MGNAAAQLTNRLHFLRKGELLLDDLELFLSFQSVRDVARNLSKSNELSRFIAYCVEDNGCPELGAVLADAPAFRHVFSSFGSGLKRALGNACVLIFFGVKRAQMFADVCGYWILAILIAQF